MGETPSGTTNIMQEDWKESKTRYGKGETRVEKEQAFECITWLRNNYGMHGCGDISGFWWGENSSGGDKMQVATI